MRYFTPVLLLATAVGVYFYNQQETGQILLFPFIETLFPDTRGDLMAQARLSVFLLAGLGAVLLVLALFRDWRDRQLEKDLGE